MSGAHDPTERLYYTDAYRADFAARVVDTADEGRRVYLDTTAFYPTSGGQAHDLGTLGGVPIVDVVDEDRRIAHLVAKPLSSVDVVGKIDWRRRFDHMQQHTGQHLLSAVFEDLFEMPTVSVHFGDEYSTLDLEGDSLSADKLRKAERRANAVIAENRPVAVTFEDASMATGLRKAVDRAGTLRVITIEGLDRSACGGTHVRATGEIGCALLRGTERIRKTIRVQFVCGLRGVERASADFTALTAVAAALSAKLDDAPSLVASQAAQLKDAEQARRKLEKELAGHRAAAMFAALAADPANRRIALQKGATATMDELRVLGQAVTELPRCVLVATTKEGHGLLVASNAESEVDAGKLIRDALAAVGGKGGGSPRLAQGTAPSPDQLDAAFRFVSDSLAPGR